MKRKKARIVIIAAFLLVGLLFTVAVADQDTADLSSSARNGLSPVLSSSIAQGEVIEKEEIAITPNVPDPDLILQGGDDISSATPIPGLPYSDEGTTAGYTDDYDEACPWESDSPDVVYSYEAEGNMNVCITLCNGSDYDTKLFVYENEYTPGDPYACNDDACPGYVSRLEQLFVTAGNTYYIVIDGYGGGYGNYVLDVFDVTDCVTCPDGSTPEGEPDCYDGYNDQFNGGCGSDPVVFGSITCGETVCGTSGTFLNQSMQFRDTDWYEFHLDADGDVNITAMAEFYMSVLIIQPGSEDPCGGLQILYTESVPICEEYSYDVFLGAGDYWIWVSTEVFEGIDCGSEYYLTVTCEEQVPTLSEWGMILLGLLVVAAGTAAVVRKRQVARA